MRGVREVTVSGWSERCREYLEDGVVVDGGEVEREVDPLQPGICQVVCRPLVDIPLSLWEGGGGKPVAEGCHHL